MLLMPAGAAAGNWYDAERAGIGMIALWCIYFALQIACPTVFMPSYVKLAGLLGLFLGWLSWGALLLGVVVGLVAAAISAKAALMVGPKHSALSVAYAPCMIAGAGGAVFAAAPVLGWYGALIGIS
jgi:leader peptidase (prepilin peptidase)/N-methyltransferase